MTPCLCDPTIRCDEGDCGGCECRVGTCWACAPRRCPVPPPRSAVPARPTAEDFATARRCTRCNTPVLSRAALRDYPELRHHYRHHAGHGLCSYCSAQDRWERLKAAAALVRAARRAS